jgi:hypothetical protein
MRHIIANEYYVDIDAVNCHPTILLYLCGQLGLETPNLRRYVEHRAECFEEIAAALKIDKDSAKTLMLMIVYGGKSLYNELGGDRCAFTKAFRDEVHDIGLAFCRRYPEELMAHLARRREKGKWEGSDVGSFFNMYVIGKEVEMLEVIYAEMNRLGLCGPDGDDVVLCYDGLMVKRSPLVTDELLTQLSDMIHARLGMGIKLTTKAMTPAQVPPCHGPIVLGDEWLKYLDSDKWDEFPKLAIGMPIIANETSRARGYCNNEMFTLRATSWCGTGLLLMNEDGAPVTITMKQLREDFRPGYCITSHKAQGATIRTKYGIHEMDKMDAHGAYVAITRATDIANIVLFTV